MMVNNDYNSLTYMAGTLSVKDRDTGVNPVPIDGKRTDLTTPAM